MVFVQLRHQQLSLKIIPHVLLRWNQVILRVIWLSILFPSCSIPHELQKNGEIEILQTKSCDNLADLFTKSLPYSSFHKCVESIGMKRLRDMQGSGKNQIKYNLNNHHITLFSLYKFYSYIVFSYKVFNDVMLTHDICRIIYFSSLRFFEDNIETYWSLIRLF